MFSMPAVLTRQGIVIPAGLIIPYTGGAGGAPDGWSLYNAANGKYIVGAGDTYAVDANGAGTGNFNVGAASAGGHTGNGDVTSVDTSGGRNRNSTTEGAHVHTFSLSYTIPYQGCYLIKADAALARIPINGVVWTYGNDKSGVATNIWTDGYIFASAAGTAAGGSPTQLEVSDAAGSHDHGNPDSGDGGGYDSVTPTGSHTHSETFTMTNNIRRARMAAWRNAAAEVSLSSYGGNIIGMYESTTPPDGWFFCNGNNGTPDLRNYFIEGTAHASAGVSAGDGSIAYQTAGTLTHATHQHRDADETSALTGTAWHGNLVTMGAHAQISSSKAGFLPAYYSLAFIMSE